MNLNEVSRKPVDFQGYTAMPPLIGSCRPTVRKSFLLSHRPPIKLNPIQSPLSCRSTSAFTSLTMNVREERPVGGPRKEAWSQIISEPPCEALEEEIPTEAQSEFEGVEECSSFLDEEPLPNLAERINDRALPVLRHPRDKGPINKSCNLPVISVVISSGVQGQSSRRIFSN